MVTENTTAETTGAYSVCELAQRLGVSPKSVWKWHYAHRMPGAVKIGRSVRFDKVTIEKRLLSGELLHPESRKQ